MKIDKNRKIRHAHRTFVYKTVGNVEKILTTRGRFNVVQGKVNGSESLVDRKIGNDQKAGELTKPKELEKEIEDSCEFCEHVYSILEKTDLSLEKGKHGEHTQAHATN